MYCYLQMNLRMFRVLLLLPFAVSHFLFCFSLDHNHYNNSCYDQNDPRHYFATYHLIPAKQIAKVKQAVGSAVSDSPSTDAILFEALPRVAAPSHPVALHRHVMAFSAMTYNPPALFPNRASPV